jgi:hypothetical protein
MYVRCLFHLGEGAVRGKCVLLVLPLLSLLDIAGTRANNSAEQNYPAEVWMVVSQLEISQ